jgi:hypothetical protein
VKPTRTLCTSCNEQPTTARLCAGCTAALEDALTKLAAWSETPPPIYRRPVDDQGRIILGREPARPRVPATAGERGDVDADLVDRDPLDRATPRHGRLPSSPFDTPAGAVSRGGTKALARELDTPELHVRAFLSGRDRGPTPTRRTRIGKIEGDLAAGVRRWIATLHQVNVDAPRTVVTGHLLARGCTWLLWHVHDIATHVDAAAAVETFTSVARRLEALADIPAERVYVGSCWHIEDVGYCTLDDQVEYVAELECRADMYAAPDAKVVVCRRCGHAYDIADHRAWLSSNVGDVLATTSELAGALSRFGFETATGTLRVWASRGELVSHGTRLIGGTRVVPVYRVDEAIALAVRAAERAKARRGQVSA